MSNAYLVCRYDSATGKTSDLYGTFSSEEKAKAWAAATFTGDDYESRNPPLCIRELRHDPPIPSQEKP